MDRAGLPIRDLSGCEYSQYFVALRRIEGL
jgi:hypothetical protein